MAKFNCIGLLYIFQILFYPVSIYANHKSNYYFINQVIDSRSEPGQSVGNIIFANSSIPKPYFISNNLTNWIQQQLETEFVEQDKVNPYFLNLSIQILNFKENLPLSGQINGVFKFEGNFFIKNTTDSIAIFPFKFYIKYKRKMGEENVLENQLSEKLNVVSNKLEGWFKINYGSSQKLARHVIVNTTDFTPTFIDPDTLYYFQRPLTFKDFSTKKGANSRYAALIFTNFAYQSDVKIRNDTIFLDFKTKVYQVKSMSWTAEKSLSNLEIAHEQNHFSITQLVAEKFKERLRNEALPPQDFDSRIQYLFLDYYRMINKLQANYDNETNHSLNVAQQQFWEGYVRQELNKFGVKSQQ